MKDFMTGILNEPKLFEMYRTLFSPIDKPAKIWYYEYVYADGLKRESERR